MGLRTVFPIEKHEFLTGCQVTQQGRWAIGLCKRVCWQSAQH